jgi:hypothetical protein
MRMLEQYEKAAKALGLDSDKIYQDCVRPKIQEEQLKQVKRKMRREMK